MKPAPFAYHLPRSLGEALELLAAHGEEARPLAGGQSLVPMMNMRIARPRHLVDLNALDGLRFLREQGGALEIGALARHCDVERSPLAAALCPILPGVAATIAHYAIRERGTLGGSLALADPAAQWPLLAILLGARIDLASEGGARSIVARDFITGMLTTAAAAGELVTAAAFPRLAPGEGWGYRSFTRRHGDFAIVAAAATLSFDAAGAVAGLRLAVAGAADTPVLLEELAAAESGRAFDAATAAEIGRRAAAALDPPDDIVASAAFRRELIALMGAGALRDAAARARAGR